MAEFIFWGIQVWIGFVVLAALSPWLSIFDFVFILLLMVGAALIYILQQD